MVLLEMALCQDGFLLTLAALHALLLQPKWSRDGRYIVYDSSAVWSIGMQVGVQQLLLHQNRYC